MPPQRRAHIDCTLHIASRAWKRAECLADNIVVPFCLTTLACEPGAPRAQGPRSDSDRLRVRGSAETGSAQTCRDPSALIFVEPIDFYSTSTGLPAVAAGIELATWTSSTRVNPLVKTGT